MEKNNNGYFVNSVAKGFEVLNAFTSNASTMSLRDLEEKTGINKATVRRFALTLVDLGYLRLLPENKFQLSPKVLDLGSNYLETLSLPDLSLPILQDIAKNVKESTNMAVLDGPEVVYVLRVNAAERIIGSNLRIGSRLPYFASSLGKALVAWLPESERKKTWDSATIEAFTEKTITSYEEFEAHLAICRSQGYAEGNGELEIGLRSIAMPIFNRRGLPIAAINISTNLLRSSEQQIADVYLPALKEGARTINRQTEHLS